MVLLTAPSRTICPWICKGCLARLSSAAKPHARRTGIRTYATEKPAIKPRLPGTPARTRFAPSPTGYLHLGSLRTALFNYLVAKATGGQFLLRIEDTDQKRTVKGAEEALYKDLQWAGLQWDEGPEVGGPYGPYRQSERTALYREHADKLIRSGNAYRCFCSQERLQILALNRKAHGLETDHDRSCAAIPGEESERRAATGESYVVRLKAPKRWPIVNDLIYGQVGKRKHTHGRSTPSNAKVSFEDPIILKSDGLPTYHLANVVDDHYMKITHVIRATEWLSSTPKHLAMYEAFGWDPPAYAHVGLLVDTAGNKFSKRNQDTDLESYRRRWYFPEALINYVALLGWSHTAGSDVMDLQQLIQRFDMKYTKGNTVAEEGKLYFLQRSHASLRVKAGGHGFEEMVNLVEKTVLAQYGACTDFTTILGGRTVRDYVQTVLRADRKNYLSPPQFVTRTDYFYHEPENKKSWETYANIPQSPPKEDIVMAVEQIKEIPAEDWNAETLRQKLLHVVSVWSNSKPDQGDAVVKEKEQTTFQICLHHCLRHMVAGGKPGPSTAETMGILGRDVTLRRLNSAIKVAETGEQEGEGSRKGALESKLQAVVQP